MKASVLTVLLVFWFSVLSLGCSSSGGDGGGQNDGTLVADEGEKQATSHLNLRMRKTKSQAMSHLNLTMGMAGIQVMRYRRLRSNPRIRF